MFAIPPLPLVLYYHCGRKQKKLQRREVCLEILSIARIRGYKVASHLPFDMEAVEASNAGISSMEHMTNLEMSCSADWDSLLQARRKMMAEGSEKPGNELRQSIYRAQRLHSFQTQDEERRATVLKTLAVRPAFFPG